MLDPVSAVGLAAAIAQFINYAVKVLKRIDDYRDNNANAPKCLSDTAAQLKLLTVTLPRTKEKAESDAFNNETKQAVLGAVVGCQSQVEELLAILEQTFPHGGDSKWKRLGKALRSLKVVKRIQEIDSTLQRYIQSLTYHEAVHISQPIPKSPIPPSNSKSKVIYDVPYSRDRDFIGRAEVLSNVGVHLQGKAPIAIVGIGGIGKSQVAIEYCYRFREAHCEAYVFWINANSADRFEQGYKRIARILDLPGWDGYAADPLELVKDWLEGVNTPEWLLVLDGLDDIETALPSARGGGDSPSKSILKHIPKNGSGKLIVTTRDHRIAARVLGPENAFKLLEPTPSEALNLIDRKLLHHKHYRFHLLELVQSLSLLPLAITQAAAYISESHIEVETYTQLLHDSDQNAEVLEEDLGDLRRSYDDENCSSSVFRTFQISFERLQVQNKKAADILAFMGTLEECAIPFFLLRDKGVRISASHWTAISQLESLSLVTFQDHRQALSLHRLVHLCVQRWLYLNGTSHQWWHEAMRHVYHHFPRFDAFDWAEKGLDQWQNCEMLLPHAQRLLQTSHVQDDERTLSHKLHVLTVMYRGQRGWREPLAAEIESIHEYFGLQDTKWYLRTCEELVMLRREQGRYADAVQILRSFVWSTEDTSLAHSAMMLQARLELAHCLFHLGNFDRALIVLATIRNASSLVGDDDDAFRQHRCDEILGMIKGTTGVFDEAIPLFENAVNWKVNNLGPRHRTTLNSKRNLFITTIKAGTFADAVREGHELLILFREVEGLSHPRTLWIQCILAEASVYSGKIQQAEALALDALSKPSEKAWTSTRLLALAVLAASYWAQDRLVEALSLEDEILLWAKQILDEMKEDIITLNRFTMFGRYLHRRGRGATAKWLLERVLDVQERISAEEIDISLSKQLLNDLANCTCRAVDVTTGCWQPSCEWRKCVFEGVCNFHMDEEGPKELRLPHHTLWSPADTLTRTKT